MHTSSVNVVYFLMHSLQCKKKKKANQPTNHYGVPSTVEDERSTREQGPSSGGKLVFGGYDFAVL